MTGKEKLIFSENYITLKGHGERHTIMHVGETEYMKKLAEIVTKNGGDILEIGFGMHISADFIQSNPKVTSHTIIEVHPEIYERALEWSKNRPNTKIILGDWIDILPLINSKFDGIFYDPYNDYNYEKFLNHVSENCKNGTIVGFYDYPLFDLRLNGIRVKIEDNDLETIPFRHLKEFSGNQYEIKYTTFDGNYFYRQKEIKNII